MLALRAAEGSIACVARPATLFRVKLELSDVDRGVYESLDVRLAQHPSEDETRLVCRLLAYALLYEEGLEFGRGLSDADEPALWVHDLTGRLLHWVDVGIPSAERIHTANKKAERLTVVCHKGKEALAREMSKRLVHGAGDIRVLYLEPAFVAQLAEVLERNVQWTVVRVEGEVSVIAGAHSFSATVEEGALPIA